MDKKSVLLIDSYRNKIEKESIVMIPGEFIGKVLDYTTGAEPKIFTSKDVIIGTYISNESFIVASFDCIVIDRNTMVFVDDYTGNFGNLFRDNPSEFESTKIVVSDEFSEMNQNFYDWYKSGFYKLKEFLEAVLSQTSDDKEKTAYRIKHCEKVAFISNIILNDMLDNLPQEKTAPFNESDYILHLIKKYHLEWTVGMVAYFHDMYKYAETVKVDHGKIAAKQFRMFCKMSDVPMNDITRKMKEAIEYHSNKSKTILSNVYFSILCDADILSKFSEDGMKEKMLRNPNIKTMRDAFNDIRKSVEHYKYKTSSFDNLYRNLLTDCYEMINERM